MTGPDRLQLNVQLRRPGDVAAWKRKLARVPGVLRVTQTFPDDPDERLSRMFVLEIAAANAEDTLAALRGSAELQVDSPVLRKLID